MVSRKLFFSIQQIIPSYNMHWSYVLLGLLSANSIFPHDSFSKIKDVSHVSSLFSYTFPYIAWFWVFLPSSSSSYAHGLIYPDDWHSWKIWCQCTPCWPYTTSECLRPAPPTFSSLKPMSNVHGQLVLQDGLPFSFQRETALISLGQPLFYRDW